MQKFDWSKCYVTENSSGYKYWEKYKKYKKKSGLTQEQVIARLQLQGIEISRSSYSQIECGTYNIRVSELVALSKLFQTDINSFFEDIAIDKSTSSK